MNFYFLIEFQFLGFRYHGWQKQTHVRTIQGEIEKTLKILLTDFEFKTIGGSRTDSMVSADQCYFLLMTSRNLDRDQLLLNLNKLLSPDIKIVSIESVESNFSMIQQAKLKEYHYYFSYGEKAHPFAVPFMSHFNENLDIPLMQKGAKVFKGTHFFKNYCYRPRETQNFEREIIDCEILINDILTASFFPKESYVFKVQAKSYMRHQARLMMGGLLKLGMKQISLDDLSKSLEAGDCPYSTLTAPASGLMLKKVQYI